MSIEIRKDQYLISTEKALLDVDFLHEFLTRAYWSPGISKDKIERKIKHSLCFGIYEDRKQIGFARVISDFITMAYLADVFIIEAYRGKQLSKWLIASIMSHPELQGLKLWLLKTRDAHALYKQFGFTSIKKPDVYMEIINLS